jgi:hypothetical protein
MTPSEVSELLVLASTVDNRSVPPETVTAVWYPVLRHLENVDAIEGMRMHFRESDKYMVPNHVVVNAKRAREARERDARRNPNPEAIEKRNKALGVGPIVFDRAEFDRLTNEAAEAARLKKASDPISKEDY